MKDKRKDHALVLPGLMAGWQADEICSAKFKIISWTKY